MDCAANRELAAPSSKYAWLYSLAVGQVISVLITGTGIFSTTLAAEGVNIPVAQSSLNYILLSSHLLLFFARRREARVQLFSWKFGLWAVCDVEANFLVVWSYQYTSIASVMLLDCFAIPCAMMISCVLMGRRYGWKHILGCTICGVGLVLTVVSDLVSGKVAPTPSGPSWLGDIMVLLGAALYSLSNVLQEKLLKSGCSREEALGMLGLFGSGLSCVQAAVLERQALAAVAWTRAVAVSMLGYQLCLFGMYVLTSVFLQSADAALFNLSLLTSDVYAVIFSWRAQHFRPSWVYVLAFASTLSGLAVYHTQPPPVAPLAH